MRETMEEKMLGGAHEQIGANVDCQAIFSMRMAHALYSGVFA
jgi:hypothetical protein